MILDLGPAIPEAPADRGTSLARAGHASRSRPSRGRAGLDAAGLRVPYSTGAGGRVCPARGNPPPGRAYYYEQPPWGPRRPLIRPPPQRNSTCLEA